MRNTVSNQTMWMLRGRFQKPHLNKVRYVPKIGIDHVCTRSRHQSGMYQKSASVRYVPKVGFDQLHTESWHQSGMYWKLASIRYVPEVGLQRVQLRKHSLVIRLTAERGLRWQAGKQAPTAWVTWRSRSRLMIEQDTASLLIPPLLDIVRLALTEPPCNESNLRLPSTKGLSKTWC